MKRLIILIPFIFSSCVTTNITSNKAADFNEKISKLFITIRGSEKAKPFFNSFIKEVSDNLSQNGIPSKKHYFDPLSLETEKDVENKIADFGPNLIMVVNQTESRNTVNVNNTGWGGYGTNTGGTFDVRIYKPGRENPVWRASLKADSWSQLSETAKKSSILLLEKLTEDGLL